MKNPIDEFSKANCNQGSYLQTNAVNPLINACSAWSDIQVSPMQLFINCFNVIPNIIKEEEINCKKASAWLIKNLAGDIKEFFYAKRKIEGTPKTDYDDLYFVMKADLLVYLDTYRSTALFLYRSTPEAEVMPVVSGIKRFTRRNKKQPNIHVLISKSSGLDTRSMELKMPKLKIEDNYNDDLLGLHPYIVKRLASKNEKGILLLHGKPGTGKTSYIRYLASLVKKDVIFFPPESAASITDPHLLSLLISHKNSVLVIEDAESIITDRGQNGKSPVAALLNICDGLLSDSLGIQVICSFNTPLGNVDKALLRKGRLIACYEFKELETNKASQLSQKLGHLHEVQQPSTLSEIYNPSDLGIVRMERQRVGFGLARVN